VYDDRVAALTYCNAGHNPPLYFTDGGHRRLTTGGTVVGIFPDAEYEEERLALRAGDLLLAYTDGIVECVNEYGEEFGEERLVELVQRNYRGTAEDIQKAIVDRVLEWAYEEERDDDMTILVARIA
jgi:sigma-B regulation protein RsbU (phosphoserine phosphatase)